MARLSRKQLATKAGISHRRLEALEISVEGIRPETAQALAEALGCTVAEITAIEAAEVAS